MPRKNPPTGTNKDLNLATLVPLLNDEDKAREFLEKQRWPDGVPYCPHCGGEGYALTPAPGRKDPGLKKCRSCRKKFTVRVGSIFEDSKLPLSKWLMAFHLMTSSKKGISSHQMARELGITQKSAWHVCHRVRECMKLDPYAGMLGGAGNVVEADETWVGGKPRRANNKTGVKPENRKCGPGQSTKTPVMVLVERGGKSVGFPIEQATALTLKGAVKKLVDSESAIHTDESTCYFGIGKEFAGGHHTVKHHIHEYVRYEENGPTYVANNSAESWFALLKRAHYGIHHSMSVKHLARYCTERTFMWNNRQVSDGERMVAAIEGAEGKRLMYKGPKGGLSTGTN